MRHYVCAVVALLFSLGCRPHAEPARLPFTLTEGGLIGVRVTADTVAANFLLDTGAGLDVVAPSFLNRIASHPAGRYTGFRHTGERVDFRLYRISSLTLGPIRQANPLVGVLDVLDEFNIPGILSAKLFESQPVTFDFVGRQLIFETPASLETRLRDGRIGRLALSRDRDKALELYAEFLVADTVAVECELDTGLDGYALDAQLMQPLGIRADAPGVSRRQATTLLGAPEVQYRTRLPRIALRDDPAIVVSDVDVVFKPSMTNDCLVGTAFWRARSVTLDLARGRLIVGQGGVSPMSLPP